MASPAITHAETLLTEGYAALRIAGGSGASDTDLLDVARVSNRAVRAGERALVAVVAELGRCGVFAALGQRTVNGIAELLSIEITRARRLVLVADAVAPRVDLHGQQLPPRLPATAEWAGVGTRLRVERARTTSSVPLSSMRRIGQLVAVAVR